jgi:hypothetical protein
MRFASSLLIIAGALLTGCATTISQLDKFKDFERKQDYTAIESQQISASCFSGSTPSEECAQLTEIQGRACMTLAQQEAAPNAACPPPTDSAKRRLQCAAQNFAVAQKGSSFSADDVNNMIEMRARALYCGATFKTRADGLPDAREATRQLDTLPETAARDQLAAATLLYVANDEQLMPGERCNAARQAVARANRGLGASPSESVQQGLRDTMAHARSVASSLTDCQVP